MLNLATPLRSAWAQRLFARLALGDQHPRQLWLLIVLAFCVFAIAMPVASHPHTTGAVRKVRPTPPAMPFPAKVLHLSGQAWVKTAADGDGWQEAAADMVIPAGSFLRTGQSSVLTLAMGDGNRVVVPSNSHLKGDNKRNPKGKPMYLARFDLEHGRIESYIVPAQGGSYQRKAAPVTIKGVKKQPNSFEVNTPGALLGVRGTHFRVWWDKNEQGGVEVLHGLVVAQTNQDRGASKIYSASQSTRLPKAAYLAHIPFWLEAGQGLHFAQHQPPQRIALLDAPTRQTDKDTTTADPATPPLNAPRITATAVTGAHHYKLQLARDASFLEVVYTQTSSTPVFDLVEPPAGLYHLRLTALDALGHEGKHHDSIWIYQGARPAFTGIKTLPDGSVEVSWQVPPELLPRMRHRFELAYDNAFKRRLITEDNLFSPGVVLSRVPEGKYYWRAQSFLRSDSGTESLNQQLNGELILPLSRQTHAAQP